MFGAGNFGNNMHFIGDNADFSGNNLVAGIGSIGNNMSIIGDDSTGPETTPSSAPSASPITWV